MTFFVLAAERSEDFARRFDVGVTAWPATAISVSPVNESCVGGVRSMKPPPIMRLTGASVMNQVVPVCGRFDAAERVRRRATLPMR